MTQWLVFRLEAPMAAFGEDPGNAARGTAQWPTKSALCGLVGAALGVLRGDSEGHRALANDYRFVIRADRVGTLLRDFHTYQSLPSAKGRPQTRAAALRQADDLVTSITRRDYRIDVAYAVAMRATTADPKWPLDRIAAALRRPVFVLSLGRRSCPPGSPLGPILVDAVDGPVALENITLAPGRDHSPRTQRTHAAEAEEDLGTSNRARQKRRRHDVPVDRNTWHFAVRDEWVEDIG